jgi:hypothetical protein
MKKDALGVDIGNVIIDHRLMDKGKSDEWQEKYLASPPVDGVFESLKTLNKQKFKGNIFLVSKCRGEAESLIKTWFTKYDFFNRTGIKPENVFFCRERADKEKICQENNIAHFIDDRLEVLSHMVGVIPNLYLFQPDEKEVAVFKQFLPQVLRVENWSQVMNEILYGAEKV